jgi:hypothetical protein
MSDNQTRTWLAPTLLGVFLIVIAAAVLGGVALSTSTTATSDGQTALGSGTGTAPQGGSTVAPSGEASPAPSTQPSSEPGSPGIIQPPLRDASPVPQESGIPIQTNYTLSGTSASNILTVHTQRGGCQTLDIHVAAQSTSQVVLFVKLSSTATTATVACPMYIQIVDQPVTLDAPLGSRSVVDQSTGKTIPVS